jgi:hypothetical protein
MRLLLSLVVHVKLQLLNHHGLARRPAATLRMLGQTQQKQQLTKPRSKDLGERNKWLEKDKSAARR